MNPFTRNAAALQRRDVLRTAGAALLGLAVGGCGGGGSSSPDDSTSTPRGTTDTSRSITSNINGKTYPLYLYMPPDSAGPHSSLPIVYALDGDTWFNALITSAAVTPAIVVGIGNSAQYRNNDFVPPNSCTSNGGGEVAFFQFITQELTPYIEGTIGGDPAKRALLGHSHGGAFVLYALFAQAPDQHHFSAYLASDASVSCMPGTASAWESDYAAAYTDLPVRLHLSYATGGNYGANLQYSAVIEARHYKRLVMVSQAYPGSHTGIIPLVFPEAFAFAFAANA